MQSLLRRTAVSSLVGGAAVLSLMLASAAHGADPQSYDVSVTSPVGFGCVAWEWQGDYNNGAQDARAVSGTANEAAPLGGIMAAPGDEIHFTVYDGGATATAEATGGAGGEAAPTCAGNAIAEGTATAPTDGNAAVDVAVAAIA